MFAAMAGDPVVSEGDNDDIDSVGDERAILVETGGCFCGCAGCGGCCC